MENNDVKKSNLYFGIDYSIGCPAITRYEHKTDDNVFDPKNCTFAYVSTVGKSVSRQHPYRGMNYPIWNTDMHRYDQLVRWAIQFIHDIQEDPHNHFNPPKPTIYIEGYAMQGKGQVFDLAENTGILKYMLWHKGIQCKDVAPTTVKKFGAGHGFAQKHQMVEAFEKETGLKILYDLKREGIDNISPASDIADSYFICKYGFYLERGLVAPPVKKVKKKSIKKTKVTPIFSKN